jgi:hypothetical protein
VRTRPFLPGPPLVGRAAVIDRSALAEVVAPVDGAAGTDGRPALRLE